MTDYLHPIADRDPLYWIVRQERTALNERWADEAKTVCPGDRIFLYSTTGCFRNPAGDRGRVLGEARVAAPSRRLPVPVRFGNREYHIGVNLSIHRLARVREGIELAPLVGRLATFPESPYWSVLLRRALVRLVDGDGDLLSRELEMVAPLYPETLAGYRP